MNSTLVRDGLKIQCTVAVPGHSTLADLDIDYQGAELTVSVNAESIVLSCEIHPPPRSCQSGRLRYVDGEEGAAKVTAVVEREREAERDHRTSVL